MQFPNRLLSLLLLILLLISIGSKLDQEQEQEQEQEGKFSDKGFRQCLCDTALGQTVIRCALELP